MQMMSGITLINLVKGKVEGKEVAYGKKKKRNETKLEYFILSCGEGSACACLTSRRDDFTMRSPHPLQIHPSVSR